MLDIDFITIPLIAGILVIIVAFLFYWYSTQNFDYWSNRNIPFVKPVPFIGSIYAYTKRGELTYEALQSMKYLDNVISETLRLYPPAVRTEREAASEYKLGETGITLPKGMVLTIPIYAMHRDAKFFPNPDKFDPDRFNQDEKSKREQYAYLPFGAGPRNCVGMRFALMEIKVCLAYILANYKVSKCPQTKVPIEFLKGQGTLQPKEIYVSLESRNDNPIVK